MLASEVIKISINRPYAEVYAFLVDPLNFARWASVPGGVMTPLDGGDWLVDLPRGRMTIRFAPRNNFGVLDYQVFPPGESSGRSTAVRLVPNGNGCELMLLWINQPGADESTFRSDVEWAASDMQRLKSLLEGG